MTIRRAAIADAARVDELLRATFGASYLEWTIFRSPKSLSYLRALIADPERTMHEIFVSDDGFYDAVRTRDTLLLNYIGSLRRGEGRRLFDHFESRARELGLGATALDVFASNEIAHPWYARSGYVRVSSSWQALVPMQAIQPGESLPIDDAMLRAAFSEEENRGFSKIVCGAVEVGLIAGDTARLLAVGNSDPVEAATRVAATFDRDRLIVPGLRKRIEAWPGAKFEELIRMRKEIRR